MHFCFFILFKNGSVFRDDLCCGGARSGLPNADHRRDAALQFRNVRDDTDDAPALADALECTHGGIERVGIERAEALVDENGIKPHRARVALHDVRKPEREGKGCQKLLAARKCLYGAARAAHAVQNLNVKPAVARAAFALLVLQGVAPAA